MGSFRYARISYEAPLPFGGMKSPSRACAGAATSTVAIDAIASTRLVMTLSAGVAAPFAAAGKHSPKAARCGSAVVYGDLLA
jgi:hypothetical protein